MDFASFYDKQADYAGFRNDPESREEYSVLADWKVRMLVELIPENFKADNILEVGCAFGVLLNNIADRLGIKNRTGIDISGNNIVTAKNFFPDCSFFHGTLEAYIKNLPEGIQKHDIVVLSDIVEHVPDDLGFMKMAGKVSKYTLLNLPLEKSYSTRNRQYGEQDPSGHLRCYDKKDAGRLVRAAGFEIIDSFTAIGFFDKEFLGIYKKRRKKRVDAKPLLKRLFWTLFYSAEDSIKLLNRRLTAKFIGENYFALLKPKPENPLKKRIHHGLNGFHGMNSLFSCEKIS
jgi:SAM-dependent methyltransferase